MYQTDEESLASAANFEDEMPSLAPTMSTGLHSNRRPESHKVDLKAIQLVTPKVKNKKQLRFAFDQDENNSKGMDSIKKMVRRMGIKSHPPLP